ncbi:hypothetical protein FJT64_018410 [Amphibalanus amphitrite]|uniref:CCHC-type domain-containing protein n=1 Tax=Amphibalanus amphitrite TaxID=1232801 RepID=A0A6A4X3M3_AMPAM|nr:hypothetical protein FJT64_018410 [Amphibalanus amphitrite]
MRQVFVRLCQRVTGRQYASTDEWRKRWAQNLTLYRKRQRMVRSSAQLRRDTTIALLDVNQHMLSIWHNREQKSESAADPLQGVCLPDRLHTLAEPAPPARDLPQLPPQPTADRRPKHQLESPADTTGTSFWRAKKREEMDAKGFVRPARACLCKICHKDVKASSTHERCYRESSLSLPRYQHQQSTVYLSEALVRWNRQRATDATQAGKTTTTTTSKLVALAKIICLQRDVYGMERLNLKLPDACTSKNGNLLPAGRRGLFRAVLTHKLACDRAVVVRLRGRTLGNIPNACRNSTAELHDEASTALATARYDRDTGDAMPGAAQTATWATSVGKDRGEVLTTVVTTSERLDTLEPVGSGRTGKERPHRPSRLYRQLLEEHDEEWKARQLRFLADIVGFQKYVRNPPPPLPDRCNKCGETGHLARCCARQRRGDAHAIQEQEEEEEEAVAMENVSRDSPVCMVQRTKRCRHGGHLKPGCCHGDLKPRRCHGDLLHWGDTSIDRRQFPRGE